jgi:hypothetical protein
MAGKKENKLAGRKSDRGRRPEKEWQIIGIYFNYLNKFGGKNFVRTTSQNFKRDHDIVQYHTRAPQCDANISTLCSPVEVFERGTGNFRILRSPKNLHWRIRPGV